MAPHMRCKSEYHKKIVFLRGSTCRILNEDIHEHDAIKDGRIGSYPLKPFPFAPTVANLNCRTALVRIAAITVTARFFCRASAK
jgi:hypothetical protein